MREASPLRYRRQISIKPKSYYSTYFYHLFESYIDISRPIFCVHLVIRMQKAGRSIKVCLDVR